MNRATYKRVFAEVDAILLEDWDPIGINDEPEARDEYTTYVPGIINLLIADRSRKKLSAYLEELESDWMGVRVPSERRVAVAKKLLSVSIEDTIG